MALPPYFSPYKQTPEFALSLIFDRRGITQWHVYGEAGIIEGQLLPVATLAIIGKQRKCLKLLILGSSFSPKSLA